MGKPTPSPTAEIYALRETYAALNRNDIDAVVEPFDPQIAWIEPAAYAGGGTYRGRSAVKEHLSRARGTWAEGTCEPERFVVAGDKIVVLLRVRVRLTHEREWREGRHAAVYTFRDGKATEMRLIDDEREALEWAGADTTVALREITAETVRSVIALSVADDQKGFVAPNAVSLSQALFAPEAWYRAIYVGEVPAGFVMLADESLLPSPPPRPQVAVWRFMVDARFQRRGVGREALSQVIDHVRSKGRFTALQLSYVPGPGCPEPFYLGLGFRHTGKVDDGEIVLEIPL